MKVITFCVSVFLFIFCVFTFNSVTGGGVEPDLIFTSWQAGQGVKGGPSDAKDFKEVWKTFITDTETTCKLNVTVGYAKKQPANAYKLHRYEWEVTADILHPGLPKAELKKQIFRFVGKQSQEGDTGNTGTTFRYSGNGTLSEHWHPTGTDEEKQTYCVNYEGNKQPQRGRSLSITVKFIGYYGTDPNDEKKTEIELPLATDITDQMRQEYLDQKRLVPARGEFLDDPGNKSPYNHGHYEKLMDGGLAAYRLAWLAKCNELWRQCSESHNCTHNKVVNKKIKIVCKPPNCPEKGCTHKAIAKLTLEDFEIKSAYRHPHHNDYHAVGTALHGLHQYGYALDITTPDIDGDGKPEQVKNDRASSPDGAAMSDAAYAAGADWCRSWEKYKTITHADWRFDYKKAVGAKNWPPAINSSGQLLSKTSPEDSTPTTPPNTPTPTPIPTPTPTPTPPSTITYACSVHSGGESGASSHVWSSAPCGDATHAGYLCQINASDHEWVSESCPSLHAHYECDGTDHSLQASCSVTNSRGDTCTVTSFYACASHTHQYPARCARSACAQIVSHRLEHRQTCSAGHTYWTCISGATHDHTTVFTCRRPGCGVTFTRCINGICISNVGTRPWHWAQ